jgi:hypothetical protein
MATHEHNHEQDVQVVPHRHAGESTNAEVQQQQTGEGDIKL